jgi:hypothetical protein
MDKLLEESLDAGEIATCVKDSEKRVLSQNDYCRKICGERQGEVCEMGCMALYAQDTRQQWKGWGSRVYKNSFLHGSFFDVTLLCSAGNIITFLQSISKATLRTHLNNVYRKFRDLGEVPAFMPANRIVG